MSGTEWTEPGHGATCSCPRLHKPDCAVTGTEWTGRGEGHTFATIRNAMIYMDPELDNEEVRSAWVRAFESLPKRHPKLSTASNLRLTGSRLVLKDLKRIAEAK